MIRQHPARVLGVTFLLDVALLLLSGPGAHDTHGAWYYISAVGWFGFLATTLVLLVLVVVALLGRRSRRPVA